MMFRCFFKAFDPLIAECDESFARIVTYPPLLIRESLKQKGYLLLSIEPAQGLHHAAADFPGGIFCKGCNPSTTRTLLDGRQRPDAVQSDIHDLMAEESSHRGNGLLHTEHSCDACCD